ncbi:MAG: glucoamylase family protein [Planctomycetota bacterium]
MAVDLPDDVPRPPFDFTAADAALLDQVQLGAFRTMWRTCHPETGMVLDRSDATVVNVAGVGFQLSAICVGIERDWITREEGRARTLLILRSLRDHPDNRKEGMYYHFVDPKTGGPGIGGYERVVSTIDTALLLAGIATASSYFGGEIARIGDGLIAETNWRFFLSGAEAVPHERGFISLGWKPLDPRQPTGEGELLPFHWIDSGDEHLLVYFMAIAAPIDAHRVDPRVYYTLRRTLGEYQDSGPMVWFPWSGALFTNFFAHCWIDYASIGIDDPRALDVPRRPRVDWWANSYKTATMHRLKAIENEQDVPNLGPHAWGLTSSDSQGGYLVPALFPDPIPMPGARPDFDYATERVPEKYGDGTIAPYGAGCAVMFTPRHSIAALRHYIALKNEDATPLVWDDPATGGEGFFDSFHEADGWVSPLRISIDQGPLVLAIENARTGMVWDLFHRHPAVQAAMDRLKLERNR